MGPIVIINPNSTTAVTDKMAAAVESLRIPHGPVLECVTLEEGPAGIETEDQVAGVVTPICNLIRTRQEDVSAFVIGCYSDPGLQEARELSAKPVFGIAESAMLTAMTKGSRFGVISILEQSIPRHAYQIRKLGFESRCAGDRAIGLRVTELADPVRAFNGIRDAAELLRDEDGADVLILGCSGMADNRHRLEEIVGLPVVEQTQAAAAFALGTALLS